MSYQRTNNKKLLTINELPEIERGSFGSRSSTPLLTTPIEPIYKAEPIKSNQVGVADESYAHTETQHTHLIGDLAWADRLAIATLNWKETIRRQMNTQKYLKFKAPYQLNRKIQIVSEFKKTYMHTIPIIDPQSSFLTYWKIPVLFITLCIFIEVPLIIFFGDDFYYTFKDPLYTVFRLISILVFLIDIFVEFHVAFYRHGALVKNRHRVALYYLKGMFLFDFIPVLQLIITSFSYYLANIYTFHMLFLLKMYPVYQIDQRFQDKLQIYQKAKSAYIILRMIVEIIYLTHFFGCIFFGTGMYMLNHMQRTNSWLTFAEGNFGIIQDYDWTKRYVLSTYWAFATLTTVAYGDITPMNEFEIIVSEIAMVAALFLVALNVANIQQTFQDYFDDRRKYQKEIVAITKFMRQKNVSKQTERDIRNFLEHYFKEKRNRDQYMEEQVIVKLAPQLKQRLMFEAYQQYLYSVPWISQNFSAEFIKELSQCCEEVDYSTKENIFLDGGVENTDDNALYFVQIGHIEIFINVQETCRQEVLIAHLKCGAHFGDYAFLSGMDRKASARSKKYSQVVKITRTQFIDKLFMFPMDHQRFCYLRDEIIFNQAYYELGLTCYTCQATDHVGLECPMTHLSIGMEVVKQTRIRLMKQKMERSNLNPNQNRAEYLRLGNHKTRRSFKLELKDDLMDEYCRIVEEKSKFEAFYTDNNVIIESWQVDKIENFVNYYPDSNFDQLMNVQSNQKRHLIFAQDIRPRRVSGSFVRTELL